MKERNMCAQLTLRVETQPTPLVAKTVEILGRELRDRGGIDLVEMQGEAELALDIQPGIGTQGFRIEAIRGGQGRRITGNDDRGLLYGAGKYLRGCSFGENGTTIKHNPWMGVSVPKRPVRGMYFATHFHNFYHDAPVEQVTRYVEELALWGCNALSVWFDMHHYHGINDPAALAMIARLRLILKAANSVGMAAGLTALANEAFADSPEALRADWTAGHDGYFAEPNGHYHVEICPNKPGGLDLILKYREEMLAAFADLDIGYVWNWPYDQGGCTCSQCTPWGANGFLKISKPYAALVHRMLPQAKIVLSTWYFDHFVAGEWDAFAREIGNNKPEFADYLLADDYGEKFPEFPLKHGVPGGLPMLNFPEISMYKMWPWGGYGANPLPRHLQQIWDTCGNALAGGFPYSEGIYEDMNKAITFQHCWDDRNAVETVREYAASVTSPELSEELVQAVLLLENQHEHSPAQLPHGEELRKQLYPANGGESEYITMNLPKVAGAAHCEQMMLNIERRLTKAARGAWRWRLLRLRAQIDAESARTGGRMSERLDHMLEELVTIYFAQNAEWSVCPQSRQSILRLQS
jgi:hypothetical protein